MAVEDAVLDLAESCAAGLPRSLSPNGTGLGGFECVYGSFFHQPYLPEARLGESTAEERLVLGKDQHF